MNVPATYMNRCLQLAQKGEGFTSPNPMVGAVIVHNDRIIGEGYHRHYGAPHAEVNAIRSVKDESLLTESTMYVSLEPCSHYGKTPPCADLIIQKKIPHVVIATPDPNPLVSGNGILKMKQAGIDVTVGMMEKEAKEQNRVFFTNQLCNRPYIILKWAQSKDGFIDHQRTSLLENAPAKISNALTHTIVHKFRTRVQGIMVGTNTVIMDNPRLTARHWFGNNPTRIVIDRKRKIPTSSFIFDDESPTIVFTESADYPVKKENVKPIYIDFTNDVNEQIMNALYAEGICSVLIEGGARLLNSFINSHLWDEAFVEISQKKLENGVLSPKICGDEIEINKYLSSIQLHLKNKITRKFL